MSKLLAFAFLLASCAVAGPDYERPKLALPASYLEGKSGSAAAEKRAWWAELNDPALDALIQEAGKSSFDLRIAAARVEEIRALYGVARAAQGPNIDVTGSATRRKDSENSLFGGGGFDTRYSQYQLGVESSWELDFWGRVRRQVEAASADEQGAEEMRADAWRVLCAQIVGELVSLRGAQQDLEVTKRNAATQSATLELTERLAASGLGNQADVARARGLVRETEAAIPLLEAAIAGSAHRLAVLTGGNAETVRGRLAGIAALPGSPPSIAMGVPSDLLEARPDIRAAERELAAATARIGVATGDLFPRVSLNGRFGLDSIQANKLFESDSVSFGIGPALRWPLLDYGKVRAQIDAQGARQRAALARYERLVAQAISEVEVSMASLQGRLQSRDSLAASLEQHRESLRIVEARYRAGAISFLDILDAQRRVLGVEAAFTAAQTALWQDFVNLHRALGGKDR